MHMRHRLLATLLGLGLLGLLAAPMSADDKADGKQIAKLIEQLGADSFAERQKANQALDDIGVPALEALRAAQKNSDAEIRKRANDLVSRIEKRALTGKLLDPTQVHLKYKDTPIKDAVTDFAKKTGYTIVLHDPENKLKDKKITLDTGKTTFWAAMDKFCAAAGLVEGDPNTSTIPPPPIGRPIGGGIKIAPGGVVPVPAVPVKPAPGIAPVPVPDKPVPAPGGAAADKEKAAQAAAEAKKAAEIKEAQARAAVAAAAQARVAARALVLARQPAGAPAPAILPLVPPIGPGGVPGGTWVPVQPGQITLVPGKATVSADTSSAVRVRLADSKRYPFKAADKEISVVLEVSPEPRLRWQQLMSVTVEKAVDDGNQKLVQILPETPMGGVGPAGVMIFPGGGVVMPGFPGGGMAWYPGSSNGLHHHVAVRLKKGDKESKQLKELKGVIAAQVLTDAEQFIVVTDVMKSAGKSFKGKTDGEIKINTTTKNADGSFTITFDFTQPMGIVPETTTQSGPLMCR